MFIFEARRKDLEAWPVIKTCSCIANKTFAVMKASSFASAPTGVYIFSSKSCHNAAYDWGSS